MKCVDLSCIQEISPKELIYINDSGNRIVIDLNVCAKQYAMECEAETGKLYPANCHCIGDRWVCRYFELYAKPEHIRFTMQLKPLNRWQKFISRLTDWNFYRKELDQFHKIQS